MLCVDPESNFRCVRFHHKWIFPKAPSKIGYVEASLSVLADSVGIDSDAVLDWGFHVRRSSCSERTKRATAVEESKMLCSSH